MSLVSGWKSSRSKSRRHRALIRENESEYNYKTPTITHRIETKGLNNSHHGMLQLQCPLFATITTYSAALYKVQTAQSSCVLPSHFIVSSKSVCTHQTPPSFKSRVQFKHSSAQWQVVVSVSAAVSVRVAYPRVLHRLLGLEFLA
jgi:hypothetical protein